MITPKVAPGRPLARRFLVAVAALIVALPIANAFVYVARFAINVPVADQWDLVPLFAKLHAGTLTVGDLFAQHNEHRMFFPEGIMLLLGQATRWDTTAESYVEAGCFVVTLFVLLLAIRSSFRRVPLFLPAAVALLVFSLRPADDYLLGFNLGFTLAETGVVTALYLLSAAAGGPTRAAIAVAGAIAAAIVASFSSLAGLFAWPGGLLLLWLRSPRKSLGRPETAAWIAAGLASWIVYFWGWHRTPESTGLRYFLHHVGPEVHYFFVAMGASLFSGSGDSFAFGIVIVVAAFCAVVGAVRSGLAGVCALWLALLGFSLLTMASITIGRTSLDDPLTSRYALFSLLTVISMLVLATRTFAERGSRFDVALVAVLAAVILPGLVGSYRFGNHLGHVVKGQREAAAYTLATFRTEPRRLFTGLYRPPSVVPERAPILERLRYSVFSTRRFPPLGALRRIEQRSTCSIDQVNGVVVTGRKPPVRRFLTAGTTLLVTHGWCVDPIAGRAAGGAYMLFDGRVYPALFGGERADLARQLGEASRRSGFTRFIYLPQLGSGHHLLSAIALTSDRTGYFKPNPSVEITIR